MGSGSSPEATGEEEPLVRNVQEETMARKHHGQGSSSVIPESPSRFWPAAPEAAKNSAAPASAPRFWRRAPEAGKYSSGPTSASGFWRGAPQGAKNSRSPSWSAGRSSHERSTVPDVAAASEAEPVPVVAAWTAGMGDEARSGLQRAAGEITALTKMKPPRGFATNCPHGDADPLHGGAMDNSVMLASACSIHQPYQQTLPSDEQIQDILKKISVLSELQKEAVHLRQTAKRVLSVTRNSSAPRILRHEQACSDVPSTSGSVPSIKQPYQEILFPCSTADNTLSSPLVPPSEEQIQDILEKFSGPLQIEDTLVRKETGTAILALCRDEEANPSAVDYDMPDMLLECPHGDSANQSYELWFNSRKNRCHPNEVPVKWSNEDDDGIPYPLYAEFCGDNSSLSPKREWDDVRVVRRLRGLRWQERAAARTHFREVRDSWRVAGRKPTSLFMSAMDKVRDERPKEYSGGRTIPEYLICPLSHELMLDPVTIATGKTFERRFLKAWFEKSGHICPLTYETVSSTIIRNDRIRGYLEEWDEVLKEDKVTSHSSRRTRQ
ncbi:uncharacterized protein LOC119321381 [Triticum dicoccoides]|uniref:uncharacterized protein LOC119321381 n=1 Tax=Triticum dicoccoides TaxID=85692 RepID=UPI00189175BD|nr:uncharacterized protein LOC119321381 [Triticum dicoccoides]